MKRFLPTHKHKPLSRRLCNAFNPDPPLVLHVELFKLFKLGEVVEGLTCSSKCKTALGSISLEELGPMDNAGCLI